jgi:hypothetical protein
MRIFDVDAARAVRLVEDIAPIKAPGWCFSIPRSNRSPIKRHVGDLETAPPLVKNGLRHA